MNTINDILSIIKNRLLPFPLRTIMGVEGDLSVDEAGLLFELARKATVGCIVEVGTYRGRSTTALALGSQQGSRLPVYAIDPHENFKGVLGGQFGPQDRTAFFRNMLRTGCTETVRLLNISSEVLAMGWNKPVGLLWIDGDHSYEGVRRDMDCWAPFIPPLGVVAFHDSLNKNLGPYPVIEELLSQGEFKRTIQVGVTTVLHKI